MDKKQRQLKNAAKNMVLLVLFLGMIVLTTLVWLSDLSMSDVPGDSLPAKIYQRFAHNISGFEIRTGKTPAAQPTRVAITSEDGLTGAQYHAAAVATIYDAVSGQMGAGLAACDLFVPSTEEAFVHALQGEVVYFGYEGYLPISLLADWMGYRTDQLEKTDLLLLTKDGHLFIHTEDGYKSAPIDTKSLPWKAAVNDLTGAACRFAGSDRIFQNVRPDTLICKNESAGAEQLRMRLPGFLDAKSSSDLTALMQAFNYDPYVRSYPENGDNARVFVENYSTLQVSVDGEVTFRASAAEGGILAYPSAAAEEQESLRLQVDFAYAMVKSVQSSMADSTQAMLFDVTESKDGVRVLTFIQLAGGILVETDAGKPFAQLEFHENQLMAARFYLRGFEAVGTRGLVLPSAQAAAAAPVGGMRQALVYRPTEKGIFTAQRVSLS